MKKTLDGISEKHMKTDYIKTTQAEKDAGIQCMPGMKKEQVELLAEEHWEWIKKLLDTHLLTTERLFKDGFKHGWKHAKGATCSTKKT